MRLFGVALGKALMADPSHSEGYLIDSRGGFEEENRSPIGSSRSTTHCFSADATILVMLLREDWLEYGATR